MALSDINRVGISNDVYRLQSTATISAQATAARAHPQPQHAQITTSADYQKQQAEMMNSLRQVGFSDEQSEMLTQIHHLSPAQYGRSLGVAHLLMGNNELFQQFVNLLKTTAQKPGSHEAVKSFLDRLDEKLGADSRSFAGSVSGSHDDKIDAITGKKYSSSGKEQGGLKYAEKIPLDAEQMNRLKLFQGKTLGVKEHDEISAYMRFVQNSVEDFPMRSHVDLFAEKNLARFGISLSEYMEISHGVSPLRLLDALIRMKEQGREYRAYLELIRQASVRGESAIGILEDMESRIGIHLPNSAPGASVVAGKNLELIAGAQAFPFLVFDAEEGRLPANRCAFYMFPEAQEIMGNLPLLATLSAGIHFALFAGISRRKRAIKTWMQFICRDKESPEEENENLENTENITPEPTPEVIFTAAEAMDIRSALGEIILPLEAWPDDLNVLIAKHPDDGLVTSIEEFNQGRFQHFGLIFRFLIPHIEKADATRRHAPLVLKASRSFGAFDAAVRTFLANPALHLISFEREIDNFFSSLAQQWPQAKTSFATAARVFSEEVRAYVKTGQTGEMYTVRGEEKRGQEIVRSLYVKGGFALAAIGDAPGALRSLTFASLVDADNRNGQHYLGEYLQSLRAKNGAKQGFERRENDYYRTRLEHEGALDVSVQPDYCDLGKQFRQILKLEAPPPILPENNSVPVNPYIKLK